MTARPPDADLPQRNRDFILAGQRAIKAKPSTGRGASAVRAGREERSRVLVNRMSRARVVDANVAGAPRVRPGSDAE